ncbi:MAG: hybrid sensor histidine kinase/response regulator [Acidiferrobacter sp.]
MGKPDEEFLKRLRATFKVEAGEHLKAMSAGLLALEGVADIEAAPVLLETIFREAHSLKGAARAVNLVAVEAVCQSLEDVFSDLKNHRLALFADLFDVLHAVLDGLDAMLMDAAAGDSPLLAAQAADLQSRLTRMLHKGHAPSGATTPTTAANQRRKTGGGRPKERSPVPPTANRAHSLAPDAVAAAPSETVRIPVLALDALLLKVEEMLSLKYVVGQRRAELTALVGVLKVQEKEWVAVYHEARDRGRSRKKAEKRPEGEEATPSAPSRLVAGLERTGQRAKSVSAQAARLVRSLEQDHRALARLVDALLADTKKMLMLPLGTVVEMLPKLVRDLSRDKGRDVEILIQGAEITIDKRILEAIKDPLIHLVRNAIDHGIEDPAARRSRGKPERGRLSVFISPKNGRKVEIRVADDGAGIDAAKVTEAATQAGLIAPGEGARLDASAALSLVFRSGLSTSPMITDLSGRGLGLAIVREKVEGLGGTVSVETTLGLGTSFRIVLPLTLQTVRGLLVTVGERLFALPAANVAWVGQVAEEGIKTVENHETIQRNGYTLPLVSLSDALGLPRDRTKTATTTRAVVVVLGVGRDSLALRVDTVQAEQEIVVKGMSAPLVRVRNIAGAAILGTGQVVPILNVSDLIKSAVQVKAPPSTAGEVAALPLSILVAEDSITARMLLKNILTAAGYDVTTAVDGAEALSVLTTRKFDLLVSDVEMPTMDGFELTEKVRAHKDLAELPIILVTALGSREHRERGIAVGANAYIVKSSFDQGNLLEIVRRFI